MSNIRTLPQQVAKNTYDIGELQKGIAPVDFAVLYVEQTLTEEEKQQARINIDAINIENTLQPFKIPIVDFDNPTNLEKNVVIALLVVLYYYKNEANKTVFLLTNNESCILVSYQTQSENNGTLYFQSKNYGYIINVNDNEVTTSKFTLLTSNYIPSQTGGHILLASDWVTSTKSQSYDLSDKLGSNDTVIISLPDRTNTLLFKTADIFVSVDGSVLMFNAENIPTSNILVNITIVKGGDLNG